MENDFIGSEKQPPRESAVSRSERYLGGLIAGTGRLVGVDGW